MVFAPDGSLLIGTGDGSNGLDSNLTGLNPGSLWGKLLRIDVDGARPYAIPGGNAKRWPGTAPEVYAIGLRNPWRFALRGGKLFVPDSQRPLGCRLASHVFLA